MLNKTKKVRFRHKDGPDFEKQIMTKYYFNKVIFFESKNLPALSV